MTEQLDMPYTWSYTGLTAEQLAIVSEGVWYAQKVTGNKWQAGSIDPGNIDVTFIDWGDVIESSNPKLGKPFRIEVTLYVDIINDPLEAYTMALLAFPSSSKEVQGTNGVKYYSNWATIASPVPTLIIQYLGSSLPALTWNGNLWVVGTSIPALIPFKFAQELNVGGKYIFGGSEGRWKPYKLGYYRLITFIPSANINLSDAGIGNYVGNDNSPEDPTTSGGKPKIDVKNNVTFVDVKVVASGGRRNYEKIIFSSL